MPPVEPRPPLAGNPGASRYVRGRLSRRRRQGQPDAGANAVSAAHARCARAASAGSAARSEASPRPGPDAGTDDRSSGCRGRSGCTGTTWTRHRAHKYRRAGWSMRTPAQPKCWTDSSQRAKLLWHHLHRHGVGRGTVGQASRRERPLPRPPSSASTALYRGVLTATSGFTAGLTASITASAEPTATPAPAWPPCRAAWQAHPPSKPGQTSRHCPPEPAEHQNRHLTSE